VHACGDPTLILIDDADTGSDTAVLLADLASRPPATQVRVLLITRTADALAPVADQLPDSARRIITPGNLPVLPIGAFGSADDHARWFGEAVRAYAIARHTPPPDLPTITATSGTRAPDEPILTIQAQALLTVLDTERRRLPYLDVHSLPFAQIAEALFAHEQRHWQQAAQHPGWGLADLTATVQRRAIAALMLSGAATESDAVVALRAVPDLADATAERLAGIARWAFHLYPAGPVWVQPDMLAEWFLITQLTSAPELASRLTDLAGHHHTALLTLIAHASDHMSAAIPLYVRLIQADPVGLAAAGADAALTASTARPLLDAALAALIPGPRWSPDTLADLDRHLPKGTLPRTRLAVSATAVQCARDGGTSQDRARTLLRHGPNLRELGLAQEALAVYDEVLSLYRDLAAVDSADRPGLAEALRGYCAVLWDLGRHREGLIAYEETLSQCRDLAATDPAHQPALAKALFGYGATLWGLGRHREALAAYEESLGLYQDLVAADAAHRPDFARVMNGYANGLQNLGRLREALAAGEETVALYRDLAAADAAHQPEFARALDNHAISLVTQGRNREALAARDEAVALYRVLAKANPAQQAELARTISNRGACLYLLRRYQEALSAYEEALHLYREPAVGNPAPQSWFADALIGYTSSLWGLGRHGEALAASEQAVALYRDLAADNPAHQPKLATAISGYGSCLWALRRHQDALAAFEESVALYRDLAAANPAHQHELAKALQNYGITLRDQGRREEGLGCDREALELYAALARNDPSLYEEAYKQLLSSLRRAYDLRGDHSTSVSLHLRRDGVSTD
jgi:tetratricopeptide (TPR) repeat protein